MNWPAAACFGSSFLSAPRSGANLIGASAGAGSSPPPGRGFGHLAQFTYLCVGSFVCQTSASRPRSKWIVAIRFACSVWFRLVARLAGARDVLRTFGQLLLVWFAGSRNPEADSHQGRHSPGRTARSGRERPRALSGPTGRRRRPFWSSSPSWGQARSGRSRV